MKKFLCKLSAFVLVYILIIGLLAFAVPADKNGYLLAYNKKIARLDSLPSPRLIFIGGSNQAFGIDSPMIEDSLHINVVNTGLHAGFGIVYPVEDILPRIRKGDVVVFQIEYANYFSGGNGEPETFPGFMKAVGWRRFWQLNKSQWGNLITGIPIRAWGNLRRLQQGLKTGGFTSGPWHPGEPFSYRLSNFNVEGDEVAHWLCPAHPTKQGKMREENFSLNPWFKEWLPKMLRAYEERGARVVMLPPVSPERNFRLQYDDKIADYLQQIGYPYLAAPEAMTVPDSLEFDTGYHVTREGVTLNTSRIIALLRSIL